MTIKNMKKICLGLLVGFIGLVGSASVWASSQSPVGYWLTIDDQSKKQSGVIEIYKTKNGELRGKTLAAFYTGRPMLRTCKGCVAPFTNQDAVGMEIMFDFKQIKSGVWEGKIFDPYSKTKIYRSRIATVDNGAKLKVTGYVAFFSRTQVWYRIDSEQKLKQYLKKSDEDFAKYAFD